MTDIVIKVENLSKQYRLGSVGTGSFAHDLNRTWQRLRGKDDPYLMIGEENDRTQKGSSDYVWALKDINFEVQHGEVLGIIGRNGAGKSTLLKILSRTTSPTTGSVKIKGRVASLLEVGTGFHPELSGRENIFLNGAILGMHKKEILEKFDEMVDFSGVERYIDTPVKRYSSGMYVRLAFAVAAYLEPDILIVDEVLAVGDAEFQKKALGKMKQVSEQNGRTVLFVSHNIHAISNLCSRGLLISNGKLTFDGSIKETISNYLHRKTSTENLLDNLIHMSTYIKVTGFMLNNEMTRSLVLYNENIFDFEIQGVADRDMQLDVELMMKDQFGNNVAFYCKYLNEGYLESIKPGKFILKRTVVFPENMNSILLFVDMSLTYPNKETYAFQQDAFEIDYKGNKNIVGKEFAAKDSGYFMLNNINVV
jgi:lipopolysaccharide transport system ATP-binding protein